MPVRVMQVEDMLVLAEKRIVRPNTHIVVTDEATQLAFSAFKTSRNLKDYIYILPPQAGEREEKALRDALDKLRDMGFTIIYGEVRWETI